MEISFRQGIVRYDTNQSPPILSRTSLTAASIDLNVVDAPILVTFAHYDANYLIEETRTVVGAWGSGDVNSTNGPLAMNQTQYLYWDLNLSTGALTRGWTALPWIYTTMLRLTQSTISIGSISQPIACVFGESQALLQGTGKT